MVLWGVSVKDAAIAIDVTQDNVFFAILNLILPFVVVNANQYLPAKYEAYIYDSPSTYS